MFQSSYSLVLYPIDPLFSLPQLALVDILSDINLIGKQEVEGRYLVGEQFLSLLCFLGCSPDIELFPQSDDKPYCYIEVPKNSEITQCILSKAVKLPKCPHCKSDLSQLPISLKKQCSLAVDCHSCGESLNPTKLNWRKTAVFAKNMIIIGNIYEAEAIPDHSLLDILEKFTKVAWKYAYIRF